MAVVTNGKNTPDTDKAPTSTTPAEIIALGAVSFSMRDTMAKTKRGDSCCAAEASLPIRIAGGGEIVLRCPVWANMSKDSDGSQIVSLNAGLPQGIAAEPSVKQTMLDHIDVASDNWAGGPVALDRAHACLTGKAAVNAAGKIARPARLVRKVTS